MSKAKILGAFLVLFVLGYAGLMTVGWLSDSEYEGEVSAELPVERRAAWQLLTDIDSFPIWRHDVDSIRVTGINDQGLEVWREFSDNRGQMVMEFLEKQPEERITLRMTGSSFGMKGTWSYEMTEKGEATLITIREKSTLIPVRYKVVALFAGRDIYMRNQLEFIKLATKL